MKHEETKKDDPTGEEFQNVPEWPYPCTNKE